MNNSQDDNVVNTGEAYISLADYRPDIAKPEPLASSQAHSFSPLLSALTGDHWRKGSEGIFTQVWTNGENAQGEARFKIRLAAHSAIADDVLCTVVPIIVDAGCPFKVIANTTLLELTRSKSPSEDPAGAFVTVFPPSKTLFDDLTEKLRHAVPGIKSSHIPIPASETSARAPLAPDNPWPGHDSFPPDESAYFFGREDEQGELARRLERANLTVVLGEARVGKTSLLRAGLKPLFDRMSFEPVYLRLQCAGAAHPVQQVRDEINRVLTERKINGAPFGEGQTLKDYFNLQETGWTGADGKVVVPVLIFDQFEDVLDFDNPDPAIRRTVEAFWTQIANLVDTRSREAVNRTGRTGFKVLISLRQDHLPKLLARRGQVPSITQNQFVVKPFNGWKAVQAVLGPGQRLLDPASPDTLAEDIVRRVGRQTTQSSEKPVATGDAIEPLDNVRVDPALLSFFCRQLNEARKRSQGGKPEASLITTELVAAEAPRIFEDFLHPADKAPNAVTVTEPEITVQAAEPLATVQAVETQAAIQVAESQATIKAAEPQATVQTPEPEIKVLSTETQATVQETAPQTTVKVAEPQTTVQAVEPQAAVQAPEPEITVLATEAQATVPAAEPVIMIQAAPPQATVPAIEPPPAVQTPPPEIPVQKKPEEPKEEKIRAQKFQYPVEAPSPPQPREKPRSHLKRLVFGLSMLSIIAFVAMVVMYLEDVQRQQTESELQEYISNNAAARNTFKSAQEKLTMAEANIALKESNLLALIEQTRQQENETRLAEEQYSKLADEQTNYLSRITQLNNEKAQAESRLVQWSNLLDDLTNQIANLARQKAELEARNRALLATNRAPAVTNDTKVSNLSLTLHARPNVADDNQAAAMEHLPVKLPSVAMPDTEAESRRNVNVLLTHGQCIYSESGTNYRMLEAHQSVHQGAIIETGKKSWCDIFIRRAGITVRLAPESHLKIAKLSLASENGIPVVDTLLELPYGRMFTVVRALVPGSILEISDGAGRSVIEGGGLGSFMITAPRPDVGDKLSVTPLRVVTQQGSTVIAPGQTYNAKDGAEFSLDPSTWETTLIHLDELEAEADRALAAPGPSILPKTN